MAAPTSLTLPELQTQFIGREIFHYERVDSTQSVLKEMAATDLADGTVVLADHQVHGKGRRGRSWTSLGASQLQFSIYLTPKLDISAWPLLNILAGIAAAETAESYQISQVALKWPNDALIAGKKYCGILSETHSSGQGSPGLFLGVGMNVSRCEFPSNLREIATSLAHHCASPDRMQVLARFLSLFEAAYLKVGIEGPGFVQDEFGKRWAYAGELIQVSMADRVEKGFADGIDESGALLLRSEEGKTHRVLAGDVQKVQSPKS